MHATTPIPRPPRPSNLAARGLRSAAELASTRPHGHRLRYMAGCRCRECRAANTAYERERAQARREGDWNGNVPVERARAHLAALSAQGVGRHSVSDASGVADSILSRIAAGTKQHIRARTERSILAVTAAAAADRALVCAKPTWRLLDELIDDGYTKAELAIELGRKTPALQLRKTQVTVRTEFEVQRLYARLCCCDAAPALRLLQELREEGFRRDQIESRLAELARQAGLPVPDLHVRRGRIRQDAAALVAKLHAQLTA